MKPARREQLIALGTERLAEALLELASYSEVADDLVERLLATPQENIQRFTNKLTQLKRSNRFIDWRVSAEFAQELELLLQDLQAGVNDPDIGLYP